MKKLFLYWVLLLCSLPSTNLFATHIVGGELNYRCLGNDVYQISLTIYRDCATGVPYFDNPAVVGIFDSNNQLVDTLQMWVTNDDTLDVSLSDPCLVIPPNICYHTTTYRGTVLMPFRPGGYQLVYQRCCRNNTIVNLIDPLGTGMTCYATVTEEALLTCNSNPIFKHWPEPLICNNVPVYFDHSAIDYDGDSIVYRMCDPYDGATTGNPMPQPPFNPPYPNVNWNPPFSPTNALGGTPALGINPATGLLQGMPGSIGQFVVGVCAEEYRNGVLIGTTRRDFQYNVGICGVFNTATVLVPEVVCNNGLLVSFLNQSTSINNQYFWDFGVPGITSDTSISNAPGVLYVYPDTGSYTIMLIASPNTLCADTAYATVHLQYETLDASFQYNIENCSDSITISADNLSIDPAFPISSYLWDFGNGQTSTDLNPAFSYGSSGTYIITLQVTSINGCVDYYRDTITFRLAESNILDTVYVCPVPMLGLPNTVQLNPGGNPNLQYQWSPGTALTGTNIANPFADPVQTITYTVTITAVNDFGLCRDIKQVTVIVPPIMTLSLPMDTILCGNAHDISVSSNTAVTYHWYSDPFLQNHIGMGNPFPMVINSDTTIYLYASDSVGCATIDSTHISYLESTLVPTFDFTVTGCRDSLSVQFSDLSSDVSGSALIGWHWDFGDNSTAEIQNPNHSYFDNGVYIITLTVSNADGCRVSTQDTLTVAMPEVTFASDTLALCLGESIVLTTNPNPNYQYLWSPTTGLDNSQSGSPTASPTQSTLYTVSVFDINGADTCSNIFHVFVKVNPLPSLELGADVNICRQPTTLTAQTDNGVVFDWFENNTLLQSGTTADSIVVNPSNTTEYAVVTTNSFGCKNRDTVTVNVQLPDVNVLPVDILCGADTVVLHAENQNPNDVLTWDWVPTAHILSGGNTDSPTVFVAASEFYRLIVINQFGCADTIYTEVQVNNNLPVAAINATPDSLFIGQSTQLQTPFYSDYNYSWLPTQTLNNSFIYNPIATPTEAITYYLTVTDSNGCIATDSIFILVRNAVCDEPYIFIPNAFSPDGEGGNEILYVRSNVLSELYFAVYNRWGEKVFETTNLSEGWDGTYKGAALPPDVFGYYVRAKCVNGQEFFKKGNVTLIR